MVNVFSNNVLKAIEEDLNSKCIRFHISSKAYERGYVDVNFELLMILNDDFENILMGEIVN
jgi:hypothetical protein